RTQAGGVDEVDPREVQQNVAVRLQLAFDRDLEQRSAGQHEFAPHAHADPATLHRLALKRKRRRWVNLVLREEPLAVRWVGRRCQGKTDSLRRMLPPANIRSDFGPVRS